MKKSRLQAAGGIVLASVMLVSALVLPKVYAADAIKTTKTDCSIEVNLHDTGAVELNKLTVEINFYKVADVNAVGEYTVVSALSDPELENPLDLSDLNSDIKASYWKEKSAEAKAAVDEAKMDPAAFCKTKSGKAIVEDLGVGLYLVDALPANSELYVYKFIPYLISLPNNYYNAENEDSVDEWVYDLVGENAIRLKTEKKDRFGNLEITKELQVYNETVGGATFVFQIEGTKTDPDTEETKVVYSDVVSMTFRNPGTDRIVIEDLPAGSEVVVTEVYSGASYELKSDAEVEVTIEAGETTEVYFENTYDGRLNGGYGVVNQFVYDSENKGWTWEAVEDSTQ